MDQGALYLTLCIIVLSARICGEASARAGMPPVLGELLAGVLLGPSVLGAVAPAEIITFLAEIGILLFIFGIGLESDLGRLVSAGKDAALVAVSGVILPIVLIYPAMRLFGFSTPVSLFAAGAMTATSIGVTMRVLQDLGHLETPAGQTVLGAAVLDDILGIVLLALLLDGSGGGDYSWWVMARILLVVAVVLCVTPLFSAHLTHGLEFLRERRKVPGLLPSVHVASLFFFAWASRLFGVPEILGAFSAGLLISQEHNFILGKRIRVSREFVKLLHDRIQPVMQLLTPIFFVNVGLGVNLREIPWTSPLVWGLGTVLLVLAVIGKCLAGMAATNLGLRGRLLVGMAMVPRAEVGLIFAELGRSAGLFDPGLHAVLIAVVIATTFFPPLFLRYLIPRKNPPEELPLDSQIE